MACAAQPLTLGELRHALAIRLDDDDEGDYKPSRVPEARSIQAILGSLVIVDDPPSDQALIRFAHKSVPDFFKGASRIKKLSDHLRDFFVDERAGNLELGRHCLKYLGYRRYRDPEVDIDELLADARGEHAFLRYATAFWFQHLEDVDHTDALFAAVRDFAQGTAFATHLAVQARVRPHLFAPYTECWPGAGGYAPAVRRHRRRPLAARYAADPRGVDDDDDDDGGVSVPLPDWLDAYEPDGPAMIRALCDHVREWHEVLLLPLPRRAPLDQAGRRALPGLAASRDGDIRMSLVRAAPEPPISTAAATTRVVALADVMFRKSKLHARLVTRDGTGWRWLEAPVASGEPCGGGPLQLSAPPGGRGEIASPARLVRFGVPGRPSSQAAVVWSVNRGNLAIEHSDGRTSRTLLPDDAALQRALGSGASDDDEQWNSVAQTASTTNYGAAFALQMSRRHQVQDGGENETDSAYYSEPSYASASSWSDSESDSGSDDDSSSLDASSDGDGDNGDELDGSKRIEDCLVVFCDGAKPVWIPLADTDPLVSCAFHPAKSIVVWSPSRCSFQLLDLDTGMIESQTLEEPAAASGSATKTCRGK